MLPFSCVTSHTISLASSWSVHFSFAMSRPPLIFQKKLPHKNIHTGRFVPRICMKVGQEDTSMNFSNPIKVKAIVTIKLPTAVGGLLSNLGIYNGVDCIVDLFGKTLLLELVSSELEKDTIKGYAQKSKQIEDEVKYETDFELPQDFGEVGAVLVENEHHKEMYLKDIVLNGFPSGPVNLTCKSWVHSKHDNPVKRVFFTNKSYLPLQTPSGLKKLREEELVILRGNGQGERKSFERIYDYDVYNDLGDPDTSTDLKRPVLGGKLHPYPRRCRTGRKQTDKDPPSEKRSAIIYVPRDEAFSEAKQIQFTERTTISGLNALLEFLDAVIVDKDLGFPSFTDIDSLFKEGMNLPQLKDNDKTKEKLLTIIPRLVKAASDARQVLRFDTPETINRDRFFWFRDEEFARETLAGVNPYSIQLVKEWPLRSKLDTGMYGPPESAITREVIEQEIKGHSTVEESIKANKLFILDYHDLLLPFVSKVREIKGTTLYGSRTLFFLNPDGTLRPLAIELTRPPMDGKPQWKQVFTPSGHATGLWLWRLAKAHVLAHDSGYHELVSHWLRTHGAVEPYVIATYRQLSSMHPIYRLLHPHLRYTMEINSLAREALINSKGIIEISFSPQRYSMELSSAAYDQSWRFDLQALPADLIHRGMAVEDPTAPHGLKLTVEDYPFANDGLLLWDTMKQWVTDYVTHYYPLPSLIESDEELQAWWTEIRTVGHGDKKDEAWWPVLKTPKDLIDIITTIIWGASAHHAAVNFGQYAYGGYFPNRPTIARTKMPTEENSKEEWDKFMNKPEQTLLECFPSQLQATIVMAVLEILSDHSPEEEYIGKYMEPSWDENYVIKAAFERFRERLKEIEEIIDSRNANEYLKNRTGAGILPYELLKPFSGPGVTGKGVPYSISI
ncbi:Lipoxygenase [Quillaja saponaria]|uniref:Lipoxygenase n=1 Tax=Quillaja saponaria TaxID=32244 RepID=A0AAD7VM67_QUISA|nr:Lipoxygenase [Quillaja saponaria]